MYASFFGLQQPPFSIAPDPRYLYMSERHREALAHLLYGVQGGGGFVLLTGEIGAGKTTVCRCFLEQVPPECQVAYIFNPRLTAPELLQTVCEEFGIPVAPGADDAGMKARVDALNRHLLAAHAGGRPCLLIIDEAQQLSAEVLEQLRLLTNLETNERKLLQIILIGQPELRDLLAGPGLEQLAQRVIARYHLGALGRAETAAYVAHRLSVAGLAGPLPFDAAALRRIQRLSGGVPRRINLLCDRALLGAFAEGRARVGRRIVDRAAAEVFGTMGRSTGRWRGPLVALALAGGLGGAVLVGAALLSGGARRTAAGAAASAASAPGKASAAVAASSPGAVGASGAAPALASASAAAPGPAPAAVATVVLSSPAASAPSTPAASAAVPAAPGAAGAAPAPGLPAASAPWPGLAVFTADEPRAWRELAPLWGWQPAGDAAANPCTAAPAQGLRCFRSAAGTLLQLRQLDRPAWLLLRDGSAAPRHARLLAVDERRVLLAAGGQAYALPIDGLARWWRGEFATLWRAPEAYGRALEPGSQGPAVDALARGLARWRHAPEPPAGQVLAGELAAQLAGFQLAQGLQPDGLAGPTTFMRLNRWLDVAEPRLAAGEPGR